MAKRINAEQFLELAKDKIGNQFEYNLENYKKHEKQNKYLLVNQRSFRRTSWMV